LHADLAQRKSPLLEWSHLKVVNLNLASGLPPRQLVGYLENEPGTRSSAVLTEKLAELYWSMNQYSDSQDTMQAALRRGPSPQQKVRIYWTLNERWRFLGRTERQFNNLEEFVRECPDYPDLPQLYRQLAELADKMGKKDVAEKYRK
jgi:tetratricopeptide (TPR) repeat protein